LLISIQKLLIVFDVPVNECIVLIRISVVHELYVYATGINSGCPPENTGKQFIKLKAELIIDLTKDLMRLRVSGSSNTKLPARRTGAGKLGKMVMKFKTFVSKFLVPF